jgi:adenylate cyclase
VIGQLSKRVGTRNTVAHEGRAPRGGQRSLASVIDERYATSGLRFLRRALYGQLVVGLGVGIVGALLTRLYGNASATDLVIFVAFSLLIGATFGAFAIRPIHDALEPIERWSHARNEGTAGAAWDALADLPFAVVRRRGTYPAAAALIALWDFVGVRRLGLSAASSVLFVPGSVLVWLYWIALRFFVMEQLTRPALADIGCDLPDGGATTEPRITLARRLLAAVLAITVIAGTVVAGIVGSHTLTTLAVGVGASLIVAFTIAALLIALLADSVAGPIGELRTAAERVGTGDLEVRVPVVSVDETGALARSFNSMVEGLRERERIRDAFGTYVDRDVADHILREGTDLAGEQVEVTMMFLDVRDFTGFAERSSAPEVVSTLNRLFELIVPVIHEHGGHVDKFVGDGLLAVFGAPRRHHDHADQALAAALAIEQAVRERGPDGLAIGIGLNSGDVVAGNVGGGGRLEFSVIGDAVNVAARVESATRQTGDTILLAENVKRLLRGNTVHLDARPGVPLKGKRESIMLYAPGRRPARSQIE